MDLGEYFDFDSKLGAVYMMLEWLSFWNDFIPFPYISLYCQLHLPVNAPVQNMFPLEVKRLSFRCQILKFSCPNVKCSA